MYSYATVFEKRVTEENIWA